MRGQFTPSRFSSAPKAFSTFTYTGDPNYYERLERSRRPPSSKQASSAPSSPCGSNQPFKICGVPSGPRHTGTFAVFTYDVDPAERRQAARKQAEQQDSERVRAGAFVAGGRPKDNKQAMQGRLPELLKGVHKTLLADWLAFHSMSVDAKGYVLAIFAAESLSAQRRDDLHTYMNRFVGHHRLATLFGLTRDPKRWGVVHRPEGTSGSNASLQSSADIVMYALRPPWVPNEPQASARPRTLGEVSAASES
tara:strand:- start:2246 stop:2995 length:750 start_codon:yes stop_codon:yes gene_type:complete